MYFYTLFYPRVFQKNTNNITRIMLSKWLLNIWKSKHLCGIIKKRKKKTCVNIYPKFNWSGNWAKCSRGGISINPCFILLSKHVTCFQGIDTYGTDQISAQKRKNSQKQKGKGKVEIKDATVMIQNGEKLFYALIIVCVYI